LTYSPPRWDHRCVRTRVALALMLAFLVPGAGADAQVRQRPVQAQAAGDLFLLTAAGGELERVRGRKRLFRLVLRRPADDVTGFTDRPARRTGQQPLARFVRRWARLGFAEVPPNAAVVLADAPSNRDVLVVELSRPRLGAGGRTLAFRAEVLRGNPRGPLRGLARSADRRVSARFGRVSLFIDPGGQEVSLVFRLSNVPQSGSLSISFVDGNGRPTAQVDLADDLFVQTDGPTRVIAALAGFVVTATGSSPLNGTVQIGITVDAGAQYALGRALISPGASATATNTGTRQTLPVTNGEFRIPIIETPTDVEVRGSTSPTNDPPHRRGGRGRSR
jgi:hypothetical protein